MSWVKQAAKRVFNRVVGEKASDEQPAPGSLNVSVLLNTLLHELHYFSGFSPVAKYLKETWLPSYGRKKSQNAHVANYWRLWTDMTVEELRKLASDMIEAALTFTGEQHQIQKGNLSPLVDMLFLLYSRKPITLRDGKIAKSEPIQIWVELVLWGGDSGNWDAFAPSDHNYVAELVKRTFPQIQRKLPSKAEMESGDAGPWVQLLDAIHDNDAWNWSVDEAPGLDVPLLDLEKFQVHAKTLLPAGLSNCLVRVPYVQHALNYCMNKTLVVCPFRLRTPIPGTQAGDAQDDAADRMPDYYRGFFTHKSQDGQTHVCSFVFTCQQVPGTTDRHTFDILRATADVKQPRRLRPIESEDAFLAQLRKLFGVRLTFADPNAAQRRSGKAWDAVQATGFFETNDPDVRQSEEHRERWFAGVNDPMLWTVKFAGRIESGETLQLMDNPMLTISKRTNVASAAEELEAAYRADPAQLLFVAVLDEEVRTAPVDTLKVVVQRRRLRGKSHGGDPMTMVSRPQPATLDVATDGIGDTIEQQGNIATGDRVAYDVLVLEERFGGRYDLFISTSDGDDGGAQGELEVHEDDILLDSWQSTSVAGDLATTLEFDTRYKAQRFEYRNAAALADKEQGLQQQRAATDELLHPLGGRATGLRPTIGGDAACDMLLQRSSASVNIGLEEAWQLLRSHPERTQEFMFVPTSVPTERLAVFALRKSASKTAPPPKIYALKLTFNRKSCTWTYNTKQLWHLSPTELDSGTYTFASFSPRYINRRRLFSKVFGPSLTTDADDSNDGQQAAAAESQQADSTADSKSNVESEPSSDPAVLLAALGLQPLSDVNRLWNKRSLSLSA